MNFNNIYIKLILMAMLLSIAAQELCATGILYVRPRFSTSQYEEMWIKNIDVTINIQDQVAETTVDQIFYNDMDQSVETIYIFPLPENAMMTKLVYWFNGEKYEAAIRERQEAVDDYNEKLSQWMDPALLEYIGDNLFRLSIVPVPANSEVRTEITYVEMLDYDFGQVEYKYLLNTYGLSPKPMETVHLSLDAQTQNTFKYFQSPSHENSSATQITQISESHYTLEFGVEDQYPTEDLVIQFETVRDDIQFNLLTYTPTEEDSMGEDSFYTLWVTPPDEIDTSEIIAKDIVFTVDVSSSMDGERLDQVKQSLLAFLDQLNPADRFNIVTFGTHVVSFQPDLVSAQEDTLAMAETFSNDIAAYGMTNISAALDTALNQSYREDASKNLIFLTDGRPTLGLTSTDTILAHVEDENIGGVKIFTFGVGDDYNKAFLANLARENSGYPTFISADDDIYDLISKHFLRISKPVLTDLEIDFGTMSVWDRYPKTMEDLFYGLQAIDKGLYRNSGAELITLKGKIGAEEFQYSKSVTFPDSGGYRFVPRLWAKAKIDFLLEQIEIYGESQELIDQIIELSLKFGILTEYTAYYSDPEDGDGTVDVDEEPELPDNFTVNQNYPNPFNPSTNISFSIPNDKASYFVTIKIYDVLGRLIKTLVNEEKTAGNYTVQWNGLDEFNHKVSSGIYLYTVQADQMRVTKKMILLK